MNRKASGGVPERVTRRRSSRGQTGGPPLQHGSEAQTVAVEKPPPSGSDAGSVADILTQATELAAGKLVETLQAPDLRPEALPKLVESLRGLLAVWEALGPSRDGSPCSDEEHLRQAIHDVYGVNLSSAWKTPGPASEPT